MVHSALLTLDFYEKHNKFCLKNKPKGAKPMDQLSPAIDFRPRSRQLAMGGIKWLPRITDKARAKLRDTIGDYIYP